MYELIQVGDVSYYIQSPARIGIYLQNGRDVYLIDSGNDKDAGRKVRRLLEQNDWNLKAVLNTHSNADHIGAIVTFSSSMDVRFLQMGWKRCLLITRYWNRHFCTAAIRSKELRHKFLMAAPSKVVDFFR